MEDKDNKMDLVYNKKHDDKNNGILFDIYTSDDVSNDNDANTNDIDKVYTSNISSLLPFFS